MTISTATLKLKDERFQDLLAELHDLFGLTEFNPNNTMEEIMYRAGQSSVVDYLEWSTLTALYYRC